ncbi:hypothetical protein [Streptomyces sp. NPDC020742]|uniref:hypothetical protein n=1 Tax=Streptomyces sp. NPDC020742 TaxID=3154897 RepID=UPI003404D5A7
MVTSADVRPDEDTTEQDQAGEQARNETGQCLVNLAEQHCGNPTNDMHEVAMAGLLVPDHPHPPCRY